MPVGPEITLDRASLVPLYFQVAEQFERAIVAGSIHPGEKITNEVALARDLGLSRPTMRQAIQVLVDRGLVVRKRGVGTQVVHGKVRRSLELTSLYDDLCDAGQEPRTDILELVRVAADTDVALELQVRARARGTVARPRLRWIGDQPLALMHNYLPVPLADLESFDLAGNGLYASLRRSGIEIRVAKQQISARGALPDEARHLREPEGAPLLTMQRTACNNAGLAVEFGQPPCVPSLSAKLRLTLVEPLRLLDEAPPLRGTLTMCRPPSGCAASRAGITMSWRRRLAPRSRPFDSGVPRHRELSSGVWLDCQDRAGCVEHDALRHAADHGLADRRTGTYAHHNERGVCLLGHINHEVGHVGGRVAAHCHVDAGLRQSGEHDVQFLGVGVLGVHERVALGGIDHHEAGDTMFRLGHAVAEGSLSVGIGGVGNDNAHQCAPIESPVR